MRVLLRYPGVTMMMSFFPFQIGASSPLEGDRSVSLLSRRVYVIGELYGNTNAGRCQPWHHFERDNYSIFGCLFHVRKLRRRRAREGGGFRQKKETGDWCVFRSMSLPANFRCSLWVSTPLTVPRRSSNRPCVNRRLFMGVSAKLLSQVFRTAWWKNALGMGSAGTAILDSGNSNTLLQIWRVHTCNLVTGGPALFLSTNRIHGTTSLAKSRICWCGAGAQGKRKLVHIKTRFYSLLTQIGGSFISGIITKKKTVQ